MQYAPVTVPPFPASLPVGCSTPLRGTASSLAVLPTHSGPVAAPLEGSFTPLRISASTQALQRVRSSQVPGLCLDDQVIGDAGGVRGPALSGLAPSFTRSGRQFSRPVYTP